MPPETTGENDAAFLSKYLFMDPRHSLDKLKALRKDTYLTQTFDVFDPVTGAYDIAGLGEVGVLPQMCIRDRR